MDYLIVDDDEVSQVTNYLFKKNDLWINRFKIRSNLGTCEATEKLYFSIQKFEIKCKRTKTISKSNNEANQRAIKI